MFLDLHWYIKDISEWKSIKIFAYFKVSLWKITGGKEEKRKREGCVCIIPEE